MPENSRHKKKGVKTTASKKGKPSIGKSWFVGIGINEYQDFPNLHNAVKDVNDLIGLLREKYDLDADHVITLFNQDAARDHIIDQLHDLIKKVAPADKLLLYYSGHGHLEAGTGLAYWIPQDAKRNRSSSYIPNSTIRDYIKAINSLHTLLISDSCFSGSLFVRGINRSTAALEELERRRSRWGLVSGRHDEEVYDGEPGANSPFAAGILKVLSRNAQPKLNVARLADQVMEMTRANYRQLPEGNPLYDVGHEGGQYVFHLLAGEGALWERARTEHSLTAYNAYLDQFPDGAHADEALRQIQELEEEREWRKAGRIDRIYAYRSFLRSFPAGRHVDAARMRILQLQEETKREAAAQREEEAWNDVKSTDDVLILQSFINLFPDGRYVPEARSRIRQLETEREEKKRQAAQARARRRKEEQKQRERQLEENHWNKARASGKISDFEAYLKAYPQGHFVTEAKKQIGSLRAKNKTSDRKEGAPDAATGQTSSNRERADAFSPFFGQPDQNLFEQLFGSSPQSASKSNKVSSHLRITVPLTLEEMAYGVTKKLAVKKRLACQTCGGDGFERTSCSACKGTGKVKEGWLGIQEKECETCRGAGRVATKNSCKQCIGAGWINGKEIVEVEFPVGIEDGFELRLSKKGNAGPPGKPPGDLLIRIEEKKHPDFTRIGRDIHQRLQVASLENVKGTKIELRTIHGMISIPIPDSVWNGMKIRLKGKGLPFLSDRYPAGDLYIEVLEG